MNYTTAPNTRSLSVASLYSISDISLEAVLSAMGTADMALLFYENFNGSASALLNTVASGYWVNWIDVTRGKGPSFSSNVTRNGMPANVTLYESYSEAAFGIPFVSQSVAVNNDSVLDVMAVFTPSSPLTKSKPGNATLLATNYTSSDDFTNQKFTTSEH